MRKHDLCDFPTISYINKKREFTVTQVYIAARLSTSKINC